MQLQQHLAAFEAAGISVFAVSYDPVEVLRGFAEEFGITYPLLSDEDSAVIREYGILNTLIRPDESVYGIPYPGFYATDTDGVVAEKQFYRLYRVRPSTQSVLAETFGLAIDTGGDPHAEASADGVRVSAVLAADDLILMQRVPLYVTLDLDPGLHVYGPPVPEGFIGTTVEVTGPPALTADPAIYPATRPFRVDGVAEEFATMDGPVRISVPLTLTAEEDDLIPIDVTVRYQACDEHQCFIPQTVRLHLDVPRGTLRRAARRT